jgi:hypothetical protein
MTAATVFLYRERDGSHSISVTPPNKPNAQVIINLERLPGDSSALIHWADYHLNRPATPIEELVNEFQQAVYEETVNRSVYSHEKSTVEEDKAQLLAAIAELISALDHWKANHDEMVARNQVLRRRPDLPQECGHPKQCIGRVHEEDESEEPHCLWCGDITDMAMLVKHCSTIYSAITDGRISKPNTLPEEVERVAGDLETERTEAAVADALAEAGSDDSYRNKLYEDLREIVPYTGHFEPGAAVTIYWKPIDGEVDGPTVDHGYVFVYPDEDTDVGACVHIPHPDPRGDRDVSPEWPTVAELLSNILIERIEFKPPTEGCPAPALGCPPLALTTSDEQHQWCLRIIQRLDQLGVLRIQRNRLLSEIMIADKHLHTKEVA